MCLKASFLYAKRILLSQGTKKTVGTKSIKGAIFCIALSLIPLVVVLSVSDAMINGMTERLVNLSSSHIQLQFFEGNEKIDKERLDVALDLVKRVPDVSSAYQMITTNALVSSKKGRVGSTIRCCDTNIFLNIDSYKNMFKVVDGSLDSFVSGDKNSVLIGKGISEKLDVKSGDTIRLITTKKIDERIVPKMTSLKIAAVISCGYQELDALWLFLPIEKGIEILKPDTCVTSIMVETKIPLSNQKKLMQLQTSIENILGYTASVYRWDELNQSQFENFSSTRMLLIFIMLLIVLVSCVNISSCIVMICLERQKEIAILKSVGTSNSTICMSFIFVGLLIASLGIIIGIPCGIFISLNVNNIVWGIEQIVNFFARLGYLIKAGNLDSFSNIKIMNESYYLESIPIYIPFIKILFYIIATLILSLIASFVPAVKTGKEKVSQIFRKVGS